MTYGQIFILILVGIPVFLYLKNYVKEMPATPSPYLRSPVTPGSTKYYLGIALSQVDPRAYQGWDGKLGGTIPDVQLFKKVLSLRGFQTKLIIDGEATTVNVLKNLEALATQTIEGDTVCIVYSGHGGNVLDKSGDEADGIDETWVLWNKELLDDDIWTALKKFKAGVKVIMFSDSCHSGTVYRNTRIDTSLKVLEALDTDGLKCHLKFFGGCQDPQLSMDTGRNGLFTLRVRESMYLYPNKFLTYDNLFKRVYDRMPRYQKPTYHNLGVQIESFNKGTIL